MNVRCLRYGLLVASISLGVGGSRIQATNRDSAQDGDFDNPTTWTPQAHPSASDRLRSEHKVVVRLVESAESWIVAKELSSVLGGATLNLQKFFIGGSNNPNDPALTFRLYKGGEINVSDEMIIHPSGTFISGFSSGTAASLLSSNVLTNNGVLSLSSNATVRAPSSFINAGEVRVIATTASTIDVGTIDLDGPAGTGSFNASGDVLIIYDNQDGPNSGAWTVSNSATVKLSSVAEYRFSRFFNGTFDAGSTLLSFATVTVEGGTWNGPMGPGTAELNAIKIIGTDAVFNGKWTLVNDSILFGGTFNGNVILEDQTIVQGGIVTFNGPVTVNDVIIVDGGTVTGPATFDLGLVPIRLDLNGAQFLCPLRANGITFRTFGENTLRDAVFSNGNTYIDSTGSKIIVPLGGTVAFDATGSVLLADTHIDISGQLRLADGHSMLHLEKFSQQSSGTLLSRIGGPTLFEEVVVDSVAALAGTLEEQLTNSFIPAVGDTFQLVSAASIVGTFAHIVFPSLPADRAWQLRYGPSNLILAVVLPGDYNQNGSVDAADYVLWRKTYGQTVPALTGADTDGDGQITNADYDVWRANFGRSADMGGGAAGVTRAAVPELSTRILSMTGFLVTSVLLRRRRIA